MQGGTLAPLIRVLKLRPAARHDDPSMRCVHTRSGAALAELDALEQRGSTLERPSLDRLLAEYRNRVTFNERAHRQGAEPANVRARACCASNSTSACRAPRLDLHRDGKVDDAVLHRIESELDFEELRPQRLLEP